MNRLILCGLVVLCTAAAVAPPVAELPVNSATPSLVVVGARTPSSAGLVRGGAGVVAVLVHREPRIAHHELPFRAPEGGD